MAAELTLTVEEIAGSANVLRNTSRVRVELTVTTNSGTWSHDGTTHGYLRLDGVQIADLNGKWADKDTTTLLYRGEQEVPHNMDGTKTVTVEAGFDLNTDYTGWVYASRGLELAAIARASTLHVPAAITLGAENALVIGSMAEPFTHTLRYILGNAGGIVCEQVAGGAQLWTPSMELCRQIPNGATLGGTLTLTTYYGGSEIGTCSAPFTAYVPASAVPEVKELSVWPVNDNAVLQSWGVYVKGRTKVGYTVSADGAYGSTVELGLFSFGGQSVQGLSGTTAALSAEGRFVPKAQVRDSRQRFSPEVTAAEVTVHDYFVPSIQFSAVERCDASGAANSGGTYLAVRCRATCASVGGRNSVSLRVRTRTGGGSWSGYTALNNDVQQLLSGFSAEKSYEVELSAVDSVGEKRTVVYTVPTEAVTFMLRDGGDGAAFGKYPEHDGLDVGWDVAMNGNKIRGLGDSVDLGDAVAAGMANRGASVQVAAKLTAPGWYRVGTIENVEHSNTKAAQITIAGLYQNKKPTLAVINALMMRGTAKLYRQHLLIKEEQITEIRLHMSEDKETHYLDAYYAADAENGVAINVSMLHGRFTSNGFQPIDVSALTPVASMVFPNASEGDDDLDHADRRDNPHEVTAAQAGAVPVGRTVNGKALSSNITLTASDVGARPNTWTPSATDVGAVPTGRTVNGKALSSNISLSASDVGARPSTWTPSKSDIGLGNVDNTSDAAMLLKCWPVGSIYIAYNHTSPASLFGGTWTRIENAFLWGVGSSASIGATGGEQTHTLSESEMPRHKHDRIRYVGNTGWTAGDTSGVGGTQADSNSQVFAPAKSTGTCSHWETNSVGNTAAHNNMPPYVQVSIWRRTA